MTTTVEQPVEDSTGPPELNPRLVGIQYEAKLRDWKIPYTYVGQRYT